MPEKIVLLFAVVLVGCSHRSDCLPIAETEADRAAYYDAGILKSLCVGFQEAHQKMMDEVCALRESK